MSKRKKKRYDDDFRASAVLMLEAAGYPDTKGAITRVAKHLGVSRVTLRRWIVGSQNPPPERVVKEKRGELVDELDSLAHKLLAAIDQDIDINGVDGVRAATALGIIIDKIQLLKAQPTERSDSTIRIVTDERNPDTFAGPTRWANGSGRDTATIQHLSNGATLGKNGAGPKTDH